MTQLKEINETVYKIIGSCMEVHRVLGPGLDLSSYQKALQIEMGEKELAFEADKPIEFKYKDQVVGTVDIDFFINEKVILVLRCQDDLKDMEIQQVLRYLPLVESTMGLLVNFGNTKIQYKRIIPSRQSREIRKDQNSIQNQPYHPNLKRDIGKTREGNPIV